MQLWGFFHQSALAERSLLHDCIANCCAPWCVEVEVVDSKSTVPHIRDSVRVHNFLVITGIGCFPMISESDLGGGSDGF